MKRKGDLLWLSFSALVGGSTNPASTVAPEKRKEQWDSGKARNEAHTHWQIMQISNAINSDVTQRASEQTTAASVLWNFITTLFTCVNAFCMQLKSYFWEESLFHVLWRLFLYSVLNHAYPFLKSFLSSLSGSAALKCILCMNCALVQQLLHFD